MESSTQAQLLRHCLQNATHDTGAHPLLKTAMASLVGRISVWKIGARCARAQDVEYARQAPHAGRATDGSGHPCAVVVRGSTNPGVPTERHSDRGAEKT